MKKGKETMTLVRWLICHANGDAYRAGRLKGWRHPNVDEDLIAAVGGRSQLIFQASQLESAASSGIKEKIVFDWCNLGSEIRKIEYDTEVIPELCRREGIEDPREVQLSRIACAADWRAKVTDCAWLLPYYDHILLRLKEGKLVAEMEDEAFFQCLNAVAAQKEFVWERVFSARVFGDSKKFKNSYRDRIYTVLKKYSPYYEDGMGKDELFAMHEIHSYAQTIEWKGPLQYILTNSRQTISGNNPVGEKVSGTETGYSRRIDTADWRYGTVLNTQTLEHAVAFGIPGCKRIMTIENKANYEAMPYAEDTLYFFCHGYFTPKEVRFLKSVLKAAPSDCEFYHWGDLDYGGICIFQYIKAKVFPKLMPYKMDAASFQTALDAGAGIAMAKETRQKLEKMDAGDLAGLKEIILKTDRTIEQERLLNLHPLWKGCKDR